jgi:hypothetical protein
MTRLLLCCSPSDVACFLAVFLSFSSFSFLAKLVLLSPVEKSMLDLINLINHDVLTVIEGIHKEREMKQEVL